MAIKAGDLVMVVKPTTCCRRSDALGRIATVSGFHHEYICALCGLQRAPFALVNGNWSGYDLASLKKIDPLSQPDAQEAQAEFTRDKKKHRELEHVEALRK